MTNKSTFVLLLWFSLARRYIRSGDLIFCFNWDIWSPSLVATFLECFETTAQMKLFMYSEYTEKCEIFPYLKMYKRYKRINWIFKFVWSLWLNPRCVYIKNWKCWKLMYKEATSKRRRRRDVILSFDYRLNSSRSLFPTCSSELIQGSHKYISVMGV